MTYHLHAHDPQDLQKAIHLLRTGDVVAIPTETVYGLAGDARNHQALEKIFQAKNRPSHHPLIVHLAHENDLSYWTSHSSRNVQKISQAFWPGPLTLLLPKSPHIHPLITGDSHLIALRVPDHPVVQYMLKELGTGLAAPSANTHLRTSPTTAQHVLKDLSGRISAVLDGGPCTLGLESTILDLSGEDPWILRHGPITPVMIEHVLQRPVKYRFSQNTPGSLPIHYRPITATYALTHAQLSQLNFSQIHHSLVVISYSCSIPEHPRVDKIIIMPSDPESYAAQLYAALHEADQRNQNAIFIELPPQGPQWLAIHDRLSKATTPWSEKCFRLFE
jgi:L-threonylcarbamoyladenylate synthase